MSEVSKFIDELYNLSEKYKIDDVDSLIERKLDFFAGLGNYQSVDSVLYGLDLNRIKGFVAKLLISRTYDMSSKLIMRKDFIERAKEHFGSDAVL